MKKKKHSLMKKKNKRIFEITVEKWNFIERAGMKCYRANNFATGFYVARWIDRRWIYAVNERKKKKEHWAWCAKRTWTNGYESAPKMQLCYLTYKKVKTESLRSKRLHYLIMREYFAKKTTIIAATDKHTHKIERHIKKTS